MIGLQDLYSVVFLIYLITPFVIYVSRPASVKGPAPEFLTWR